MLTGTGGKRLCNISTTPRPPLAVNWRSTFCSPLPYTLSARTNPPSVPPENYSVPKIFRPPFPPPSHPDKQWQVPYTSPSPVYTIFTSNKNCLKISFVFFLIPFQTLPEVLAGGQISLMDICYRRYNDISVFITLYNTESDKVIRWQF